MLYTVVYFYVGLDLLRPCRVDGGAHIRSVLWPKKLTAQKLMHRERTTMTTQIIVKWRVFLVSQKPSQVPDVFSLLKP